jgi:hypothetical protein
VVPTLVDNTYGHLFERRELDTPKNPLDNHFGIFVSYNLVDVFFSVLAPTDGKGNFINTKTSINRRRLRAINQLCYPTLQLLK